MGVLGAQLVFSMITASMLSKLSGHLSFGRWIICNHLVRYLHPSDEELRKLAGVQRKHKSYGPKTDPKKAKEEAFNIPKSVDITLDCAPVTPVDVLPLRFYTDYQWLMDFVACSLFVYFVTEFYYAVFQPNEFNLSIVWCLLAVGFALKVLFSVTAIYFETEDAGERILCFVFGFFFLVLAMGVLVVSEDVLDFGLETGYHNFSSGARRFLEKQGLDSAGPASLLTFRVILSVVSAILGAFVTFPGLRLAKMHSDALRYAKESPFKQMLLHLNIISPVFIVVLWIRPVTREYLVDREFTYGRPVMSADQFDSLRVIIVLSFCFLRLLLCWTHLQAHLNMAYDNVLKLKKEAGKISSIELQKLVVRVYYYLCVVALQYFAPLVLLLLFCFMLKTLSNVSFASSVGWSFSTLGLTRAPPPPVKEGLPLSEDAATLAETAAQFSLALSNLRQVFTPLWYKGLFSFLCWWVSLTWFITSCFGLVYYQYFV